jgi:hypothetical protein
VDVFFYTNSFTKLNCLQLTFISALADSSSDEEEKYKSNSSKDKARVSNKRMVLTDSGKKLLKTKIKVLLSSNHLSLQRMNSSLQVLLKKKN